MARGPTHLAAPGWPCDDGLDREAAADDARSVKLRRDRRKGTAPDSSRAVADRSRFANSFGLGEAMLGIVTGFVLATLAVSLYALTAPHGHHVSQYGEEIVSLIGLWIGLVGAVVVASRMATRAELARDTPSLSSPGTAGRTARPGAGTGSIVGDFGFKLQPWPDVPLGIVAGLASQYLLVPVVEAPLLPFVHHLYSRLGHPAQTLTGHAFGPGLVVLAVLVCVGSPVVEELFFRGLLLRALMGGLKDLGPRLAPAASILLTALVFALAHFEALQFLGLAGFGVVLGLLAWRTGRLGPSIVAHMAFNTVTIIAIVAAR
jgi:membrane protease YdiL (CAAX protease family)